MGNATRALALGTALLATVASTSGCYVTPRAASHIATAAIWAAAIAGTVVVLEFHDDHYHHEHCGHYRRWHDARWVYYYQERWEYYDQRTGSWYLYAE
jgi:hypothetical protein